MQEITGSGAPNPAAVRHLLDLILACLRDEPAGEEDGTAWAAPVGVGRVEVLLPEYSI